MRRTQQSAFANPVLVGAVTVLVVMVAVFLAYNANRGLPFVPTKQLKVDISNGSNLVAGNDVREGGFRIGLVTKLKPIELPSGQVGAQLTLQLSQSNGTVPSDSTVTIRPRSVLGLKFIDLHKGTSSKMIPDGGTIPISQTSVPVQFDDLNKIFDAKTRPAVQQNLAGFGDTLAARGSALNDTIASLPQLFTHLQPVAHYLSAPSTELTRFFDSLNAFMGAVAPVAQTNARLFTDMATTFEAISRDPNALESTIQQSPSTLDVSTDSLRVQQPFLVDFTTFGRYMTPATAALRSALPHINPALESGAQVLPKTPQMNRELEGVLNGLRDLTSASGTNIAVNALTATVSTLNPMMRYLGPYVTVCNNFTYFWTFLSEHISEQTTFGTAQRAMINFANHQPNNVGDAGANQPANGYAPLADQSDAEYLHGPAYGAAIDNAGLADCETGQRGYPRRLNYFDPRSRNLDTDQHTPGDQGPTYRGRPRVLPGETFTRNPQLGPIPPYNPSNP
jgi:virulence factor Mce-like protein